MEEKKSYLIHLVLMFDAYKHKHISIIREYPRITSHVIAELQVEFMAKGPIQPESVCVCGYQEIAKTPPSSEEM